MKIFLILLTLINLSFAYDKNFSYRKYNHVKEFYKPLIKDTIDIALKYNVPPAALLAIASVESGYGRGYVASITGNILSLGANKNEKMLPPLYLPNIKDPFKIIYNQKEISKYKKSELVWKKRAKSLKKDYRPSNIAGTTKNLDYFDYHLKEKREANLKNIEEFASKWISTEYKFKVFQEARKLLDKRVKEKGKEILFSKELNVEFINSIGGKKGSFNYRKTWPKKVVQVLNKTGLIKLVKDINENKDFNKVW